MAFSKVTLFGETLMDVTQDTVAEDNLRYGELATGADGEAVHGAFLPVDYETPQSYGAKGDGETDDKVAFQNAFASGDKVYIPEGEYYLSAPVFADELQIVEDDGTYVGNAVIASRKISASGMSAVAKKKIALSELGVGWNWLQGCCYNSDKGAIVLCDMDNGNIAEVDYATLAVTQTATLSGLGHANDLTYNPNTQKYYVAPMTDTGKIIVLNDDLTFDETITISGINFAPSQIAYDSDNNIYYVGWSQQSYAVDANFTVIGKIFDDIDGLTNNPYNGIESIASQGSTVWQGQLIKTVWFSGGYSNNALGRLATVDYGEKKVRDCYDFDLGIFGEEIETADVIGDKLAIFSVRRGYVYVTEVYPDAIYLAPPLPEYNETLAVTRIENNYCDATAVGRIKVYRNNKVGIILFNLRPSTDIPANTTSIDICRLPCDLFATAVQIVAGQNGGSMLVSIATNGTITISNDTSSPLSGFYRACIPVLLR